MWRSSRQTEDAEERLWRLLALPEPELAVALGVQPSERPAQSSSALRRGVGPTGSAAAVCRHHCAYPERLRAQPLAPSALRVSGGVGRLRQLLDASVVAIVGAARPSDYGLAVARTLASDLAARGVTVAATLQEGIAQAAREGTKRPDGSMLCVAVGDAESGRPASGPPPRRALARQACVVSELALDPPPPLWHRRAHARTLALLADLTIVVEADERGDELVYARACRFAARALAAVPGCVDAPTSRGTNALLVHGASVVRDIDDALALLRPANKPRLLHPASKPCLAKATSAPRKPPPPDLDPQLAEVLARVLGGADTLDALRVGADEPQLLELSLTELELHGLLRRGVGGRYLPSKTAKVG